MTKNENDKYDNLQHKMKGIKQNNEDYKDNKDDNDDHNNNNGNNKVPMTNHH